MIRVVTINEVLHDASAFEQSNDFTIFVDVGKGWNAAVWVDFLEPIRFLLVVRYVNLPDIIWQSQLFESDRDLNAIRRLPCIKRYIGCRHGCCSESVMCKR